MLRVLLLIFFIRLSMLYGWSGYVKNIHSVYGGNIVYAQQQSLIKINSDIDLRGEKVFLPEGAEVVFKKGMIQNGILVGKENKIRASKKLIFKNCKFEGEWNVDKAFPEWFGAVNDGIVDCTESIQSMFDFMETTETYRCKFSKCHYGRGQFYLISKTIYIRKPVKIEGKDAFVSSRSVITFKDDPNHRSYLSDGRAFQFTGNRNERQKLTDICINIKVHAKPFYFSQLNNAYIHDCYVSTFSGDKDVTGGVYTYWYAFHCNELTNSKFENLYIDQPYNNTYNSSDGIHLSGGCHDITIENVNGSAGDDFIALNTNENKSGNIYNIRIANCTIGKHNPSVSGIRLYGCSRLSHAPGKPQLMISDVAIENCYIKTLHSPCIFFTNNSDWKKNDESSYKINTNNIQIINCKLQSQISRDKSVAIWLGGAECDNVTIDGVSTIGKENAKVVLIGFKGFNDIKRMKMRNCKQSGIPFVRASFVNDSMLTKLNNGIKTVEEEKEVVMEFDAGLNDQFVINKGCLEDKLIE